MFLFGMYFEIDEKTPKDAVEEYRFRSFSQFMTRVVPEGAHSDAVLFYQCFLLVST